RALADNYGAGWAELEQGASAMNNSGKRWGAEAEAMFARGPAGRATFIAADVREDGRTSVSKAWVEAVVADKKRHLELDCS
ncbi:hypothetical protein N9Y01_02075, partial [Candidatus Poseidonia alphae]|nr:hypothetical protein [Candidatus Poseidonia alphae]